MEKTRNAIKQKAKEVKPIVEECIRAGMDYSKTKKELKSRGIFYPNLAKTFYQWQQAIFPEDARSDALHTLSEKKKDKNKSSLLSPHGSWTKVKQKEADESAFAQVLNDAIFYLMPCPQKGLTVEMVREINLGGGVVGIVSYYTNVNLNHPVIIVVTRTILLVIKVKAVCYTIQQKVAAVKTVAEKLWRPAEPEK